MIFLLLIRIVTKINMVITKTIIIITEENDNYWRSKDLLLLDGKYMLQLKIKFR